MYPGTTSAADTRSSRCLGERRGESSWGWICTRKSFIQIHPWMPQMARSDGIPRGHCVELRELAHARQQRTCSCHDWQSLGITPWQMDIDYLLLIPGPHPDLSRMDTGRSPSRSPSERERVTVHEHVSRPQRSLDAKTPPSMTPRPSGGRPQGMLGSTGWVPGKT